MDCCAFCNATSYKIKPLVDSLKTKYKTALYRDAAHIFILRNDRICDVFYFSYGVTVCWGVSKEEGIAFLEQAKDYAVGLIDEIETDEFTYGIDGSIRILDDEITLPNEDTLSKIAVSHAIAQSVKLGIFEIALQKTFNNTKQIPEDLAKLGKITLSRKEISRKMGELFLERNSINLHVDVLDTPEFFWDYPELEPLYKMTANYLEIKSRVGVLNQRLDIIHELFDMLGNELNHQHSSRLEWIIIILIVIEVVLSIFRDVFRIL